MVQPTGVHVSGVEYVQAAPEWINKLALDPESPEARRYAEQARKRLAAEKEIRKIRFQHFQAKKPEIRQEGILKLRDYNDPALYPSLVEIFERDAADVKLALLDMFETAATAEGDTTIAWMSIYDSDAEVRRSAAERIKARIGKSGVTPNGVKLVVAKALRSGNDKHMVAAGTLARIAGIIEAIPWMYGAQVGGGTGAATGGTGRGGDLAWIMIGTQVAFVSDLQPVVSEGAVAFDPELSVITEGVILRIQDAAVYTYHTVLHTGLVDWTSDLTGTSTASLGWDHAKWKEWHTSVFDPWWKSLSEEQRTAVMKNAAAADEQRAANSAGSKP